MIASLLAAALGGAAAVWAAIRMRDTRARRVAMQWEHWRQLLDLLPVLAAVKDRTGRYVFLNRGLQDWLRARGVDRLGRRDAEVLPPAVAAYVRESEEKLLRGEEPRIETECSQQEWLPGSGEGPWLLSKVLLPGTPWGDGVLLIAKDISELHRAQMELARQRDFIQEVLDGSRALVLVLDPAGRLVRWNRECERILGYHESECRGRPLLDMLAAPESRADLRRLFERTLAGERVDREQVQVCGKDGRPLIFDLAGGLVRSERGDPEWVVITGVDRTAERRSEARQRELAGELEAIWKHSLDALAFVDSQARIVAANPGFCRLAGIGEAEARGSLLVSVLAEWPGQEAAELGRFRDLFARRAFDPVATRQVRLRDGRQLWVEAASVFVPRPGQEPLLLLSVRDVTGRIESEQQMRSANEFLEATAQWARELAEKAESASRAKTEFLAHVSHELRTPMNAILGLLELTMQTPLEESQRQNLEMARESAESLLGLVEDLLDVAKAESGRLQCTPAPMNLRETLNGVMRLMIHRGSARGILVRWQVAQDVPDRIVADPARLRQVIANLIGNALRHTRDGHVELSVDRIGPPASGRLRFLVKDTGCGVPPEHWTEIFEPFARLGGEPDSGGAGLGLTISASLVEKMGGWLLMTSEPGGGAAFGFTIPLEEAPQPGAAAASPAPAAWPAGQPERRFAPPCILVAEDNELNQRVIRGILENHGFRVTVVPDGRAAVREALRGGYDAILMDVHMPGMDGWQAARAIRDGESPGRHVPILAMTARALEEDAAASREAGMDGYLAKPVRQGELLAALREWIPAAAAGASGLPAGGSEAAPMEFAVKRINVQEALDRLGGDQALLAELAGLFLDEGPRLLGEAEQSLQTGDAGALQNAAHQLKGLFSQFCAAEAREAAWQLELEARRADMVAARSRLEALRAKMDEVLPELRQLAGGGGTV